MTEHSTYIQQQISILGIGNVLLGDDGFGPWIVEMFRSLYECAANVEIHDLGTPGLDIAPYLYDKDLVVIADAVHAETNPGNLCVYCETDLLSLQAQLRLSAHDPGVQESLAQLRIAGHAPIELIIVGVVPESCGLGEGISLTLQHTSSVAVGSIASLLVERGIDCRRRNTPATPNFWWLSQNRAEGIASYSISRSPLQI